MMHIILALVLTAAGLAKRARRPRFFHVKDYALNDDVTGARKARRLGFRWIDVNLQVTSDGYAVCTHWARPLLHGWYDPKRRIAANTPVWKMTLAQVKRLRYRGRPHLRIVTALTMLRVLKALGMGAELEVKEAPAWASSDEPWHYLARCIARTRARVVLKTIWWLGPGDAGEDRIALGKKHLPAVPFIALRTRPPHVGLADEFRP